MSLTSELERKDSWVNQFFKTELTKLTDFVKSEGAAVKGLPLKVPLGSHRQAQVVGKAFDYRLRLRFESEVGRSAVLAGGIYRMKKFGSGLDRSTDLAWAEATKRLLEKEPVGNELFLARASVVLAWLDDGYRSGRWSDGMKAIAMELSRRSTPVWDEYVASVDEQLAGEVVELFRLAEQNLPTDHAVCGPEFVGSRAVGGADADLIVESCLYDIKTSINPRKPFPVNLKQLIGYALLDWDDQYALKHAGFYFSRQGAWMSWPLSRLLTECTGTSTVTLSNLRNQFRGLAEEHAAIGERAVARRVRQVRRA